MVCLLVASRTFERRLVGQISLKLFLEVRWVESSVMVRVQTVHILRNFGLVPAVAVRVRWLVADMGFINGGRLDLVIGVLRLPHVPDTILVII